MYYKHRCSETSVYLVARLHPFVPGSVYLHCVSDNVRAFEGGAKLPDPGAKTGQHPYRPLNLPKVHTTPSRGMYCTLLMYNLPTKEMRKETLPPLSTP